MSVPEVHRQDIGTEFRVTLVVDDKGTPDDVSTATAIVFIFEPPGKVTFERAGSFVTDGTDGKVKYLLVSGDIGVGGLYRLQVKITTPAGTWHSTIKDFFVAENL